jgi:hypothetical protein
MQAHAPGHAAPIANERGTPTTTADPGFAGALLQYLAAARQLTPQGVAAALQEHPELRESVLREVGARWGLGGVQDTIVAEQRLGTGGPAVAQAATAHAAPAHQLAERDALNAVITVVARGPCSDSRCARRMVSDWRGWRSRRHLSGWRRWREAPRRAVAATA